MLDFNRYEWLSFDCYGTLVDWETGLSGGGEWGAGVARDGHDEDGDSGAVCECGAEGAGVGELLEVS